MTHNRLFWISFLVLFIELASIRWLNASVTILAYFNNLILISCFFGLGVGCLLATRKISLIKWYPFAFLLWVFVVVLLNEYGVEISYKEDVIFVSNPEYYEKGLAKISVGALLGFLFNMGLFVMLGQELGRQIEAFGNPLRAYARDIAGSICGTLSFAALAWLESPPHIWFLIAGLAVVVFLPPSKTLILAALCALGTATLVMRSTYLNADWSPYYKVEVMPYESLRNQKLGYKVIVDNLRIQDALNFTPQLLESPLWPWVPYYQLPYHFIHPSKVLVLGAGAGNEALIALAYGAREIHAVEIDPVIASLGVSLHPNVPYRDKRVKVFVDDARSYISNTQEKYDLIVMSALDSHKQIAGMASLRLESFIYTVGSFERIKDLLAPNGVFCLNLSSTRPWMGERIYWSLTKAFGAEPRLFQSAGSPFHSIAYVFGPQQYFNRDLLPDATKISSLPAYPASKDILLATDNWPFLYLETNWMPRFSIIVFGVGMLLSFLIVYRIEPSLRKPNLHFFFLGAGFMLLETRSITQMALLFGSTWNVNTIVFVSILLAILITNQMVLSGLTLPRRIAYGLLFLSLMAGYFFPFETLLSLGFPLRLLASSLIVGVPVGLASLIFSTSFKEEKNLSNVLGSNLLGVVFGGALEYTSNIWGLNTLYILALILYLLSSLPKLGNFKREAHSSIV
jgi:Spermine/spermidine synthase domain